ncbi:unnamed protein product [Rotaria sordida]|uniref:Uncharacterized protein n=1 Tax=Rotaria sordida TaxID=392033 RepID=A0A815N5R4_9BILA|nr:unnamed protein product [Rotaria sordida]CAF1428805.1 unnamed protein product [Rotaria sordida]CAF3649760.1 unnamed protein product [Rotaria sordida]CAF3712481.1 unnamed protein product [Rotaria sordida]
MNRLFSWFHNKNNSPSSTISRQDFIESLIVYKQIKEFSSCLHKKDDQTLCIDGFFRLLPTILDENYMSNLCELISKKSRLTANELSKIITNKLSRTILDKNFDLCEKILRLPFQSLKISLATYELIQLIHTCSNTNQLIQCLSILIEKNLPYDSEYLSWILIILFEHYIIGDEIIIEYLLNIKKNINLLFTCYGNNNITPLMLFFHLYSNNKCQTLIDNYLSNIDDLSILLQCDKWNRSYLIHLLCGQCQHESMEHSFENLPDDILDINEKLINQCPHASAVLSKFSMLYKLGNKCDTPIKMILTSQYCLSLRIILFNFLLENDPSIELKFDEFFQNFPSQSIRIYSKYIKRFVHNHNLNSVLTSVLFNQRNNDPHNEHTIEFLLKQGARIDNMNGMNNIITNLLLYSRSMIPFMLLDYSLYIDIPFQTWSNRMSPRMNLYICRIIQCGYPSESRTKFEEFKALLTEQSVKLVEKFIDLKNPLCLSKLCLQKLRGSLKHLGDEMIDKLKDHMPNRLRQSIILFGHDECLTYYESVMTNV